MGSADKVYSAPSGSIWRFEDVIFVCLEGHTVDVADGDKLRNMFVISSDDEEDLGHGAFAYSSPYDRDSTRLA